RFYHHLHFFPARRSSDLTAELNKVAEHAQARLYVLPVFKGYTFSGKKPPYPTTITSCINEELVHGIPSTRRLQEGDVLSIDCARDRKSTRLNSSHVKSSY